MKQGVRLNPKKDTLLARYCFLDEEQGNSIGLTNTEPRSTAEVKKNCRTASGNREGAEEPLSESKAYC